MNFDLKTTTAYLHAKRNFYGADSPEGHRCSTIIEQLPNHAKATGQQKIQLEKFMLQAISDLDGMTAAAANAEER